MGGCKGCLPPSKQRRPASPQSTQPSCCGSSFWCLCEGAGPCFCPLCRPNRATNAPQQGYLHRIPAVQSATDRRRGKAMWRTVPGTPSFLSGTMHSSEGHAPALTEGCKDSQGTWSSNAKSQSHQTDTMQTPAPLSWTCLHAPLACRSSARSSKARSTNTGETWHCSSTGRKAKLAQDTDVSSCRLDGWNGHS